jgi:hypothetical protein
MRPLLTYLLIAVTAVLASGSLSTLPASATPIPAVVANPAPCSGTDGQLIIGRYNVCRFAIEPSVWTYTGDGSWTMNHIHWTSWGAYEAQGTAIVSFRTCWASCYTFTSFAANVSFYFPVTWDGRLVYAEFSSVPSNRALAKRELNNSAYYSSGFAL